MNRFEEHANKILSEHKLYEVMEEAHKIKYSITLNDTKDILDQLIIKSYVAKALIEIEINKIELEEFKKKLGVLNED